MSKRVEQTIDQLIEDAIQQRAFPGAVLAVAHGGSLTHHKAYGYFSWDRLTATTTETVYDLASVTKVFVAMAFLKLLDEHEIHLDAAVETFVTELAGTIHGVLTLRQLLEHTSGQPRRFTRVVEADAAFTLRDGSKQDIPDWERNHRIGLLLEDLRDVELLFTPGSQVAYTSLGYFLLGLIIERVSGLRLDHYLDESILTPTGITSINYLPLAHGIMSDRVAPTENCPWRGTLLKGQVHDEITGYVGGIAGHAGLFATAQGVVDFGLAVLDNSSFPINTAVLRASTRSQTTHLSSENRGWGWLVWTQNSFMGDYVSRCSFGHTGFTGTSLLIDPENELVVALLTNRVHPTRRNNQVAQFRRGLHDHLAKTFFNL